MNDSDLTISSDGHGTFHECACGWFRFAPTNARPEAISRMREEHMAECPNQKAEAA